MTASGLSNINSGAADRAGIRSGDILVALNDRVLSGIDDVHRILSRTGADAAVEVTLISNDRRHTVLVAWPAS